MTVAATMEVQGVKEALAILNSIDKATRRQITRDFAKIAGPMVEYAKKHLPHDAPMSGWERAYNVGGFEKNRARQAVRILGGSRMREAAVAGGPASALLPWSTGAETRTIKPFTSGSKKKAAVFGMKWNSRTATLFDMSGHSKTPQGAQMVTTLGARYGSPSRIMWKAYEASSEKTQAELRALVEKIMNESSYALQFRSGVTTVRRIVSVI